MIFYPISDPPATDGLYLRGVPSNPADIMGPRGLWYISKYKDGQWHNGYGGWGSVADAATSSPERIKSNVDRAMGTEIPVIPKSTSVWCSVTFLLPCPALLDE